MNKITGTLIWYYYICKREVWLMSHEITPFQDNAFLEIGRILSNETYEREKIKEIKVDNIKVDMIRMKNGKIIVAEVKKSSRFEKAAKMQLLFYLYKMKKIGFNVEGELLFPKEKKRVPLILTKENEIEIKKAIEEINLIIKNIKSPKLVKNRFCKKCAYFEFCWS